MPAARPPATRLDPRDPLVVDTRELGRRAGSMRPWRRRVPAPAGLGLPLLGVPAGAELDLDLRLEAVMEGVLVTGTVTAPLRGECARCLTEIESSLQAPLQQLYAYEPVDDEDVDRLTGDLLDLQPAVRDAVVLALPLTPLCRGDCPGLCARCGVRLDEVATGHAHADEDPRWAALAALRRPDDQES